MSKEKKKTLKQIKEEEQHTINIHRTDNTFCRKCKDVTGEYPLLNCKAGRFWTGDTKVPTRRKVKYYVLAEAPGESEAEDSEGRFLVGRSGQEFGRWLNEAGISAKDVYVDNVVRCSLPAHLSLLPKQQRDKLEKNCAVYLWSEIARLRPQMIIAVGKTALHALTGVSTISKWIGRQFYHPKAQVCVVPILHPAAILRGQTGYRKQIIEVLKTAKLTVDIPSDCGRRKPQVNFVENSFQLKECIADLKGRKELAVDIETVGKDRHNPDNYIIGMSLCGEEYKGYFIPLWHRASNPENGYWDFTKPLWSKTEMGMINGLLPTKNCEKVFHNVGFDYNWLTQESFKIAYPLFDTQVVCSVLDDTGEHGLKDLAWVYTDFGGYDEEMKSIPGFSMSRLDLVDPFVMMKYGVYDAIATYHIKQAYNEMLKTSPAKKVIEQLNLARYNLSNVELQGCLIDIKESERLKKLYSDKSEILQSEIRQIMKKPELNINSNTQMVSALFGEGKLFSGFRVKPSTDKRVFTEIQRAILLKAKQGKKEQEQKELIEKILEYRRCEKLQSTYLDNFLAARKGKEKTARVYTHYTLDVVRTGRPSSRDLNLNNIPRGGDIRNCFVASPGCVLVDLDGSQMELRIAAELSGDTKMLDILNKRDGDIHSLVGVSSLKQPDGSDYPIEIFKEEELRAKSKVVSFSTIYGKTPVGLAFDLWCTVQEAMRIFNFFFQGFPQLAAWVEMQHARVSKYGYIDSIFGRRFYIEGAQSTIKVDIEAAYRKAVNYPVQSAASDVLLLALNRIQKRIDKEKWPVEIVLTVYDSLLFNVKKSFRKEFLEMVIPEFERKIPQLKKVNIYADCKYGPTWGNMEKVK